jgi:hypothetical protein
MPLHASLAKHDPGPGSVHELVQNPMPVEPQVVMHDVR